MYDRDVFRNDHRDDACSRHPGACPLRLLNTGRHQQEDRMRISTMRIGTVAVALVLIASAVSADPLNCTLTAYKPARGLTAAVADEMLTVTWEGDKGAELRLRFDIDHGTPTIRELAIHRKGGQWAM